MYISYQCIMLLNWSFLCSRTIKLDVNLHRFNICYWMSFSKQHGQELLADSFVLHSCNDLTLVPVEDGLFHRSAANWSVRYLGCDLTAAKVWLQSARQTADEVPIKDTLYREIHSKTHTENSYSKVQGQAILICYKCKLFCLIIFFTFLRLGEWNWRSCKVDVYCNHDLLYF